MMDSLFERMLKGAEPCVRIAEDRAHAAILEPCPTAEGHAVIFTKKKIDAFFDLTPEDLAAFMAFAQKIAAAMKEAVPCDKIAIVVYGLKVRHAHMHLIPARGTEGEIRLDKPRAQAPEAVLADIGSRIRASIK
ncbi:MAG: HIT family protein [Candidatus Omnitrophica bacterium]|nr:HIT family protein [Candidatus Omnitrophota bacterium]